MGSSSNALKKLGGRLVSETCFLVVLGVAWLGLLTPIKREKDIYLKYYVNIGLFCHVSVFSMLCEACYCSIEICSILSRA